jgi:mannose-6-phosphate isomerase-like protein (cupin superfamily)
MSHTIVKKNVEQPDEVRAFPNGSGFMRVVGIGNQAVGYAQFRPGWRWSKDMQAAAGTTSCQVDHHLYVLAGKMVVKQDDGGQIELGPGDVAHIPPGHDAWTVSNDACVLLDWTGAAGYAKRR